MIQPVFLYDYIVWLGRLWDILLMLLELVVYH